MTLPIRACRSVLLLVGLVGAAAGAVRYGGQDHPSGFFALLLIVGILAVELYLTARPRLPGRSAR